MLSLIINLLLINAILVLVHESGFIVTIDEMISERWKFYHLPYPVKCLLCSCWWASLLCCIIMGPFNLLTIMLCLINAHLTKITQPLFRLVENIVLMAIDKLNTWLNL